MRLHFLMTLVVAFVCGVQSSQADVTYLLEERELTGGGGSLFLSGSITVDCDTFVIPGNPGTGDFDDWNIVLADGMGNVFSTFTPSNSFVDVADDVIATQAELILDSPFGQLDFSTNDGSEDTISWFVDEDFVDITFFDSDESTFSVPAGQTPPLTIAAVPEPRAFLLVGCVLLATGARRRFGPQATRIG